MMSEAAKFDDSNTSLSPLKRAFLALERAEARIQELEGGRAEPIAIVGMACRIPGDEDGIDGYWRLLEAQRSAVGDGVERRFSGLLRDNQLPQAARWAALLKRVDLFDPRHFGISPREAVGMDPQQRLLLEASWEALESAGIDPFSVYQSSTGVYLGISSHDYAQLQLRADGIEKIDPHFASGAAQSVAAGRISYVLGLNGPSLAIDTACSSSLVAVHLACEALRRGECNAALAGGVNLILSPEPSVAFAQAGMLSPSGQCRSFSSGADGFVRGEGCGVLLLKRLREARASGDRILGLIVGSAVNQDGASSGLTVPNGLAQQSLLRAAHRRAGIEAWQVGYVEAHGTGTALGDPIEAEALGAVFGERGEGGSKLLIGSVKTNVGHLESAAGVAGLIKVVLGLQHGVIPGQLHWSGPSEHVRWSELPLEVVTESREWEPIGGRRIGGVSSFGFSGTNAHVVVESWEEDGAWESESEPREEVLVVTGRTEAALRELAGRYATFLEASGSGWSEICWTAAVGRAVFGERLAVVARGKAEAAEKLREWLRGDSAAGVHGGHVSVGRRSAGAVLGRAASAAEVAAGFVQGESIDWSERKGDRKLRRVSLPTYAFQRERYWIESGAVPVEWERGERTGRGLLGSRLRTAGVAGQYETQLREASWIGEHRVGGRAVLPATGHVELMLEAGAEVLGSGCELEDVVFEAPLTIAGERRVQTVVEQATGDRSRVRVYAEQAGGEWERVSEGWLRRGASQLPEPVPVEEMQGRLESVADVERFYAELGGRGLEFGDRFRGLQRAWMGGGEALGEITAPAMETEGWELAPWWLDACLQVAGLAVDREAERDGAAQRELYLPQSVARLEVYGHPGERSWSHVTLRRLDADTLSANLTVTDSLGAPLLRFSNLRFRKYSIKEKNLASLMYRLDWQPAELESEREQAAIQDVVVELEEKMEQWSQTEAVADYNDFFCQLEELSADYVLQAFQQLGWPETGVSRSWSDQALLDRWKVIPQHRRLLHRMLEIAVETGTVHRSADGICFGSEVKAIGSNRITDLRRRFPFGNTELDLVVRCGESLAAVLTGKAEGRELLFPDGESDAMSRLYRDSVPARLYNQMVAEMVARIVGAHLDATTRILEVGGGTGATTQYVLDAIRSIKKTPSEYVFTDISSALVRRTGNNFGDNAFFRANVFDLEREPSRQNINGTFSVVIAVNVLHATANLSATLDRLKPLLAVDGVLIPVEVTGKQRWADITVGLLDGWWSYTDCHVRPDYPTLKSGAWQPMLESAGFQKVVTLPRTPNQLSIFGRQELLVATDLSKSKRMLVVGSGDLASEVMLHLRQRDVLADSVDANELANTLLSSVALEAVVWVADQHEDFDRVPAGGASSAVETSIRSLLTTVQALIAHRAHPSPRLYVVTAGACAIGPELQRIQVADAPLIGLASGIAAEMPELRCTRLDCDVEEGKSEAARVVAEVLSDGDDQWVGWRSGKRHVAKLRRAQASNTEGAPSERVQLRAGSGIDALEYITAPQRELQPDEVEIDVHSTALNFRDVLQSMGIVNLDSSLGTDCTGVILRVGKSVTDLAPGDEVVAITPGCFASHAIARRALVVRKPETLSFADAAAQSIAYLTADYCLREVAQVRRGERVLIHAAAGGVGLAAVYLCMRAGAEVLATAGSERKRAFLRSLGVKRVYDSRSRAFAEEISDGVDIVLNSLAGEAINDGLALLGAGGRFIELGKTDLRSRESVEKRWPGVRYLPADLTPHIAANASWLGERLDVLFKEIEAAKLRALPVTVFDSREVKDAFRYMARAEHIGRIVVQRRAKQRFTGSHLITGGLRGIGLSLAEWLVENGVRELVLVGRRAPDEAARYLIARFETKGVAVKTVQGDIADPRVAREAVRLAGENLLGVWHGAGVLENASLERQSWDVVHTVLRPKLDGAWNLHVLTLAKQLEFFVLFSSWASIDGAPGQINHSAANAFLDGLAHFRRTNGLPALSVNWGAWADVGSAAGDKLQRQLARSGMETMLPKDALETLRLTLALPDAQIAIASIRWHQYLARRRDGSSFYENLASQYDLRTRVQTTQNHSISVDRLRNKSGGLRGSSAPEEIRALPAVSRNAALIRKVAAVLRRTLGIREDEEIDRDLPFSALGMDSLLAIELRNSLSGLFHTQFPSTILFDYPTLRTLALYLEQELFTVDRASPVNGMKPSPLEKIASPSREIATGRDVLGILNMIEQMTDQEVESLDFRS